MIMHRLGCDIVTAVATGQCTCVSVVLIHFRCTKVNCKGFSGSVHATTDEENATQEVREAL